MYHSTQDVYRQRTDRMAAELLIRPGSKDHQVVADLLSPGGGATQLPGGRPSVSRLVVDAHVVTQRPLLAQAATGAGIPFLVDPLSHLLQGDVSPSDRWARLPYGRAAAIALDDVASDLAKDELVEKVVDFQVEAGATAVIPPYLYATSPDDEWFAVSLDLLQRTGRHMRRTGIGQLPLIPLFCAQLQSFGLERAWAAGIDRWVAAALELDPSAIAFCLSPAGGGADSYHKVLRLFASAERLTLSGVPAIAWRQGIYGPALVAVGVQGYETGIGTSEQCNIARATASRRPLAAGKKRGGGAAPGVFLEPLGRSVSMPVAHALLGDLRMRPKIMCDDERCCPRGPMSTLEQHREHTVRSRARALAELDAMPQRAWRLHRVARNSRSAALLLIQAKKTLKDIGMRDTLRDASATSLARVAEHLSHGLEADAL